MQNILKILSLVFVISSLILWVCPVYAQTVEGGSVQTNDIQITIREKGKEKVIIVSSEGIKSRIINGEEVHFVNKQDVGKRNINAQWINEAIKNGKNIIIENAIIEGDLGFSVVPIQPIEDIRNDILDHEEKSVLHGKSIFNVRHITSQIIINNSSIKSDLYVRRSGDEENCTTIFQNDFILNDCIIEGDADFSLAIFKRWVSFYSSTFKGKASFFIATFKDVANFVGTIFNGETTFMYATFQGYKAFGSPFKFMVDFSETIFKDKTYFGKTIFNDDVDFTRATFKSYADFGNATFNGWAHFEKATFKGYAGFGYAFFLNGANFEEATFMGRTSFICASFTSNKTPARIPYKSMASFNNATFKDDADFQYTTFEDKATFDRTTFENMVSYSGGNFKVTVDFNGTIFSDAVDLRKANYSKLNISWRQLKGPLDKYLFNEKMEGDLRIERLIEWQDVYLKLIKNFEDIGDTESADNCYYHYRYMKPKFKVKRQGFATVNITKIQEELKFPEHFKNYDRTYK